MRVLITGKGSFIGTSVKAFINNQFPAWVIDELDVKNDNWKEYDFTNYDAVYHVAGIAHVSTNKKLDSFYFRVNRDLAIDVAQKAKSSGVHHFIFMSSMIIYGKDMKIGHFLPVKINEYKPETAYGQSKLEADLSIQDLQEDWFKVSILRSPVVYGKNARGNFPKLQKVSRFTLFVPKIKNFRSMIYIKNLAAFVSEIIIQQQPGVFYPQNPDYVSTNSIIRKTRELYSKRTYESSFLALLIKIGSLLFPQFNKIYGNKYYDLKISSYEGISYQLYSTEESVIDMER